MRALGTSSSSTEEETCDLLRQKQPQLRSRISYEPLWATATALVLGAMVAAGTFLVTVFLVIPSCHRAAQCPQQQEQHSQAAASTTAVRLCVHTALHAPGRMQCRA